MTSEFKRGLSHLVFGGFVFGVSCGVLSTLTSASSVPTLVTCVLFIGLSAGYVKVMGSKLIKYHDELIGGGVR